MYYISAPLIVLAVEYFYSLYAGHPSPPTHLVTAADIRVLRNRICLTDQTVSATRLQLFYIRITSLTLLNNFSSIKYFKMFNCVLCDKVYAHKCDLNRHAKTHDRSTNSCGICLKTFTRRDKLSIHVQKCHSKYIDYYSP